MSDLDALLDATLDDLDDLPSFEPYPAGVHRVLASMETDTVNDKPVIKLNFKYVENIELANPQDEAPKEGDTANVMFMLDNEYGIGNFKLCAAPFKEALGFTTNREIVEGVQEIDCAIVTGLRRDKNDKEKFYMNIKQIIMD